MKRFEAYLHKIYLPISDKYIVILMMIPALFCLSLGVYYWIRLIGLMPGQTWRFDLMPWYWRVMACSLAVIYPIAACGLWTASRWGIILWLAGALYEICAHVFYASYFGYNFFLIFLHIVFLSFYGMLCYSLLMNKRQAKQAKMEVEY